jgi:hypothetical protein
MGKSFRLKLLSAEKIDPLISEIVSNRSFSSPARFNGGTKHEINFYFLTQSPLKYSLPALPGTLALFE